jgi:hypothetical protein
VNVQATHACVETRNPSASKLTKLRWFGAAKKHSFAILALSVFLFVLGARWAAVDRAGSELPELDQWDAEGLYLLLPWFTDQPLLPALFAAHNEHYVVLTKLLALGLTLANGQWDQRLECVAHAFIPASVAVAFLLWTRRRFTVGFTACTGLFFAAAWGLPFAWQNVISGFHSQQYFLIALSMAAILWLPFAPFFSTRWMLGAVAAVLSLLTMASGLLAAAAIMVIVVARILTRETSIPKASPALLVSFVVVAIGWLTRHEVSYHDSLKAGDVTEFFVTLVRAFQWPAPFSPWWGLLMWLPWLLVSCGLIVHREISAARTDAWVIFALGLWVCLQIAATAYARGSGGPPPAPRYIDTLVFGSCVNLLALGWLGHHARLAVPARQILPLIAVAWLSVTGWGAGLSLQTTLTRDLPYFRSIREEAFINTRAYLATGDFAALQDRVIPYPDARAFADRLAHPELLRLLPPSVLPAREGEVKPAPLSRLSLELTRYGQTIATIALGLLVCAATLFWLSTLVPKRLSGEQ